MDCKQKSILVIKGINQYGVLSYMLEGIAAELQYRGYIVTVCNWDELDEWKKQKWDICISCQAINMTFEVQADKYVTWLVDHPVLLNERLIMHRDMDNLWIGCVDQTHVTYLKDVMDYHNVFYLPHFGGISDKIKKYKERNIEIFFPASYLDMENFVKENTEWCTGAVKVISDLVINELKKNNEISVEQATINVLEQMGETVDKQLIVECMEVFGSYVDTYICRYYRTCVVKALLDEGLQITVAGSGWSVFKEKYQYKDSLNILSDNMSYEEVLDCIGNSKIVLNVFPWFKNGSHERVTSALLNGAICLSDQNEYTKKYLKDESSAILYDRNNPQNIAKKIRYYLEHQDEAEEVAQNGKKVAMENMTVKNSVDKILKVIRENG